MASQDHSPSRKDILMVNTYAINARDVIGKGGYGIVFSATDKTGNKIAAKRIDISDERKARRVTKDLDKLLQMNHKNILQVFDIIREHEVIWIPMEFCPQGNLSMFFSKENLSCMKQIEIMKQIAEGVVYLHNKNIIHRDIKPANVLVKNDSPVEIKLTDFDLSKFLDEDYETSKMSSNVGTAAFKAPEFFLRNDQRKIEYHRSVDIYALGLTFLAMIQGNESLVPQLETAKDQSELHNPIGSTIASRIIHGTRPLEVLAVESNAGFAGKLKKLMRSVSTSSDSSSPRSRFVSRCQQSPWEHDLKQRSKLRCLIQSMTHSNPEKRPSANMVLKSLDEKIIVSGVPRKPREVHNKLGEVQDLVVCVTGSWTTGLYNTTMCVTGLDQLVVRGETETFGGESVLRVYNRKTGCVIREMNSACHHWTCCSIIEHPTDPGCILEGCDTCDVIRSYNIDAEEVRTVYSGCKLWRMCSGPDGTVLVATIDGCFFQLKWNTDKQLLDVVHKRQTRARYALKVCYVPLYDIVVISCKKSMQAINLKKKALLWQTNQEIDGQAFNPRGICCDVEGRLFVTDGSRILVLNGANGQLLQIVPCDGPVGDICWTQPEPQLTVCCPQPFSASSVKCFSTY